MTILRSGTTKKYSENWGSAFGAKKRKVTAKSATKKKPSVSKKKKAKKK